MSEIAVIEVDRAGRVCSWSGRRDAADDHSEGRLLKDVWPEEPAIVADLAHTLRGGEHHYRWCLNGEDSAIVCLASKRGALIVVHFAEGPTTLERRQRAFVESVNHELRTPLTIISGFAQLLHAQGESVTGAQRRAWSGSMVTATARLRALIDNLLDVLQDASPSAPATTVDIAPLVQRAIASTTAGKADFAVRWAGDPESRLRADSETVHDILCRLLENAASAGRTAVISWGIDRNMVAIHVRDEGGGIGAGGRAVLFTPFGTEPDSRGASGRIGLGLGLYLARRAARTLHGDLTLESSGPSGTSFLLTLPAAESADEQAKNSGPKMPAHDDQDRLRKEAMADH